MIKKSSSSRKFRLNRWGCMYYSFTPLFDNPRLFSSKKLFFPVGYYHVHEIKWNFVLVPDLWNTPIPLQQHCLLTILY